ncbi:MAG: PAS domain S-box protein [Phycisphaerae bacterium]|jgi:PAS domain S-box-containing protein
MSDAPQVSGELERELERLRARVMELERGEGTVPHMEAALRLREDLYRALFVSASDAILILDGERLIDGNCRLFEMFRATREQIMGKTPAELAPEYQPDGSASAQVVQERCALVLAGQPQFLEWRCQRMDGTCFDVEVSMRAARISNRSLIVVTGRDVTERRRAAEALRRERDFSTTVLRTVGALVIVLDREGRIVSFNRACEECSGYRSDEMQGRYVWDLLLPEESAAVQRVFADLAEQGLPSRYENHWVTRGGERRLIEWSNAALMDRTGRVEYVIGTGHDVTEVRRAEAALRDREATLQGIFRVAPVGIGLVANRIVRRVNDRMCEMVGYERAELIGREARFLYPTREDYDYVGREKYAQIRAAGTGTVETRWQRKDGRIIDVLLSSTPLDLENLAAGVTFSALDITARKQAAEDLRRAHHDLEERVRQRTEELAASEERWRSLVATAPDFVAIVDPDGTVRYANRPPGGGEAAQFIGRSFFEYISPTDRPHVQACHDEVFRTGRFETYEMAIPAADDAAEPLRYATHVGPFRQEGRIVALTLIGRDITAWRQAQEKLRRSERLASIGTLAAGIAHEINNPLGMILLDADEAMESAADQAAVSDLLSQMKTNVLRCARIVKSVLRFAKDQRPEKWPEEVNRIIGHAIDATREYARKHHVDVTVQLGEALPTIMANATELELVFVNLIHNAAHACVPGGQVMVETRPDGAGIVSVVRDNGCGMSAQDVERAFDPFYTTRLEKGGTGLGLSTCHGIVAEHGGTIEIQSEPGRGTAVTITLPRAQVEAEAPGA